MISRDKVYPGSLPFWTSESTFTLLVLGGKCGSGEGARRRPGPAGQSLDMEAPPSSPSSGALELEVREVGVGRGARLRLDSSISQEAQESIC